MPHAPVDQSSDQSRQRRLLPTSDVQNIFRAEILQRTTEQNVVTCVLTLSARLIGHSLRGTPIHYAYIGFPD
jgi:hypothetical protein